MTLITFSSNHQPSESDDSQFITWRNNNPNGFVLAFTLPDEGWVTLHSTECSYIARTRRSGAYTRGNYGKHCAENWQDIVDFMTRPNARVEECSRCSGMRERSIRTWDNLPRTNIVNKPKSTSQGAASVPLPPIPGAAAKENRETFPAQYNTKPRTVGTSKVRPADSTVVAEYCRHVLDLGSASTLQGDPYQCLPVCVIDAVFSIGVRYEGTEAVVRRFCHYFELPFSGPNPRPDTEDQLSVDKFLKIYDRFGVERMTAEVYCNRQRTSTRSGILKAEAVLLFSRTLQSHGVNYLQDVDSIIGDPAFEQDIKKIPGQGSGISTSYFYMLAGSDEFIKTDRMIQRFLYKALGRSLTIEEMVAAIVGAQRILVEDYPGLTPKSLDHIIWRYERGA